MQHTVTPPRYAWLIDRLGLNQSSAARFLGIDPRTSRRYIAGELRVDSATAMLLELMVARGISVETALRAIGMKAKEKHHGRSTRQAREKNSARSL